MADEYALGIGSWPCRRAKGELSEWVEWAYARGVNRVYLYRSTLLLARVPTPERTAPGRGRSQDERRFERCSDFRLPSAPCQVAARNLCHGV